MVAKKAAKRKPSAAVRRRVARQTATNISALIETQKKLDLQLKKVKKELNKMLFHQYFV